MLVTTSLAYQNVTPEQLLSLMATNDSLILVDVREPFEFDSGHIDGAHLYPFNSGLFAVKYAELPAGFPLYFYCGSGFRSGQAAEFMDTVSSGAYEGKIYNLTGGIIGWPYAVATGGQDGPALIIEPDSLLFDVIMPGTEAELSFTVVNTATQGTAVVLIPPLEAQGFTVMADTAAVLPGDSLTVTVKFHPAGNGLYTDSVFVFHGGAGRNALAVTLDGNSVQLLTGDIDSNGEVNILDLLELLKELSGKNNDGVRERMDLNADGVLNIFDLLRLLLLIRGGS